VAFLTPTPFPGKVGEGKENLSFPGKKVPGDGV